MKDLKETKWIQGPPLPRGVRYASSVSLPSATNFACVVVGGETRQGPEFDSLIVDSCVFGLNKALTEWKVLLNLSKGISHHIALPLS